MCSKKKQGHSCGKGVFWARIYLAVHLVLVLIPIAIVATWSVSAAWPWPSLGPANLTTRGFGTVLADSSKFGRSALLSIMRAQDLDHVITDDALPPDVVDEFRVAGVRIDIANTKEDE